MKSTHLDLFFCDPGKNTTCSHGGCYTEGGRCYLTVKEEFARMEKIDYDTRKCVYEEAIATWGAENQEKMVVEEMSELTKEICKHWRGRDNLDAIADEIADVTIMLEQLCLIYNLKPAVCNHMDKKIIRLQERLLQSFPSDK